MAHERTLRDRIRAWVGLEDLDPDRFAFLAKLERAEEDVALMRLVVVLVNGLVFLGHAVLGGPTTGAAIAVLGLAFAYATGTVVLQVRPAFGNVSWSIVTAALDAVAISAWLAATGGWASPYFPVWYASIAAVGYRYNLPITTGVASAYVGAYAAVCLATGGVSSWLTFGLRAAYIPVTGAIVGLASEGYADATHRHRGVRRRLREAIHTMDRGFAAVLADAPDRIVITDVEGRVEYANGPAGELGFDTVPAKPRACGVHACAIETATSTGDRVDYLASPEEVGAAGTFWCRVSPIARDEEPVGAVVIARARREDVVPGSVEAEGEQGLGTEGTSGSNRASDAA